MAANDPPRLFRTSEGPVRVVRPKTTERPIPELLIEPRLRHEMARSAEWVRETNTEIKPAFPPLDVVRDLLASPEIPLPTLDRIVTVPVCSVQGTLQTDPGYHADARTFYTPDPGFVLPPIANRPSASAVKEATAIIDDMLADFPFVADADRAHAWAELLLPFARSLITGPTPLHVHEAPTEGTGKDLLMQVTTWPALGTDPSKVTYTPSVEEMRKALTAVLRRSPEVVLFPNVKRTVDSGVLCEAITGEVWEDRVLGVSETIRVPVRCVWILTANNPGFDKEVLRRSIRIRLDAHLETPAKRLASSFRHPDLLGYVRANRARLVRAALTIIRHWVASGATRGVAKQGTGSLKHGPESWAAFSRRSRFPAFSRTGTNSTKPRPRRPPRGERSWTRGGWRMAIRSSGPRTCIRLRQNSLGSTLAAPRVSAPNKRPLGCSSPSSGIASMATSKLLPLGRSAGCNNGGSSASRAAILLRSMDRMQTTASGPRITGVWHSSDPKGRETVRGRILTRRRHTATRGQVYLMYLVYLP